MEYPYGDNLQLLMDQTNEKQGIIFPIFLQLIRSLLFQCVYVDEATVRVTFLPEEIQEQDLVLLVESL